MKIIKNIGLVIFLVGLSIFSVLPLIGTFKVDKAIFNEVIYQSLDHWLYSMV